CPLRHFSWRGSARCLGGQSILLSIIRAGVIPGRARGAANDDALRPAEEAGDAEHRRADSDLNCLYLVTVGRRGQDGRWGCRDRARSVGGAMTDLELMMLAIREAKKCSIPQAEQDDVPTV